MKRKIFNVFIVLLLKNSLFCASQNYDVYPFHNFVTLGAIKSYQVLISKTKGSPCPMYPNCSKFGYDSFQNNSPLKAFMMTADRLHRCGHDLENYNVLEINQIVKYDDSLQNNNNLFKKKEDVHFSDDIIIDYKKPLTEETRLYLFADSLFKERDYKNAILELKRYINYYPNSELTIKAQKKLFFVYYDSERYLDAIHTGQNLMNKFNDIYKDEIYFWIGASYFRVENYKIARTYFSDVIKSTANSTFNDKSILLSGLSYAKENSWALAEETFATVKNSSEFSKYADNCRDLSVKGKHLKLKNPTKAGLLAIVPGLGYWYDGYKQTALSSLIVNGLFFWGTSEAFKQNNKGLGFMMGILNLGWYSGNIYGSVVSAHRKNQNMRDEIIQKMNIGFKF